MYKNVQINSQQFFVVDSLWLLASNNPLLSQSQLEIKNGNHIFKL